MNLIRVNIKYWRCFGYTLVCADDQFIKPFKSYLGQDAVHKYINNMVEESKYCSRVMKKYFTEELIIAIEDDGIFESSTKCWIWHNTFVECDVKVRDHCLVTKMDRGVAHRDFNINVSLDCKIRIVFHNPNSNSDSHLIMQELRKFGFKINFVPNGLKNI